MCILRSQSIVAGLVDRIGLGLNSTAESRAAVFENPALKDEVARLEKLLLWAENEQAKLDQIEAKWNKEQQQRRSNGVPDIFGSSFASPLAEARADQPFKVQCGRCGLTGHQSARHRHCLYYRDRAGQEDEGRGEEQADKRKQVQNENDEPPVSDASKRARFAGNSGDSAIGPTPGAKRTKKTKAIGPTPVTDAGGGGSGSGRSSVASSVGASGSGSSEGRRHGGRRRARSIKTVSYTDASESDSDDLLTDQGESEAELDESFDEAGPHGTKSSELKVDKVRLGGVQGTKRSRPSSHIGKDSDDGVSSGGEDGGSGGKNGGVGPMGKNDKKKKKKTKKKSPGGKRERDVARPAKRDRPAAKRGRPAGGKQGGNAGGKAGAKGGEKKGGAKRGGFRGGRGSG
jgi:hypothetical protein